MQTKRKLKELEYVCNFINEYIVHYSSLKLVLGTNYVVDDIMEYVCLGNYSITDQKAYWIMDGSSIELPTSLIKESYEVEEIMESKDFKSSDYLYLLNVDYKRTTVEDLIKKSEVTTFKSKQRIADWLFSSAEDLLNIEEEQEDKYAFIKDCGVQTQYPCTIDGLIECLTNIKEKCGGDIPLQVNDYSKGCTYGLTAVCFDNDMGNDSDSSIVLLETNTEEYAYPTTFEFYTQGKEI